MKDVKININKNNNSDKELELFYSNQDILEVEDIEQEYTFENIDVEPDPIIIEISGLKGAGKFIYLDDTPTYYENGKFLRILDNKISYADIYWNDINGNIEERKDLIDLIKKLTDVQIQDEIRNEVENEIQKHNEASYSHPILHEKITNNFYNTNEKIDVIKLETDSLISSNYTTLDTKIDTKIDTTKSELDSTINELTETVNSNYTTLDTNKANKATTLLGYGITDAYTKKEVDAKTASVYRPKGSVSSYDDLPTENLAVGDTYNILDTGANYVWTDENNWDKLSETVDLTPFLTKEDALKTYDTINSVDIKISTIQNIKQDRLTAGDGISIKDNVISGAKIIIRDWSK